MAIHICKKCNKKFEIVTRGRPPSFCVECKTTNNSQSSPVVNFTSTPNVVTQPTITAPTAPQTNVLARKPEVETPVSNSEPKISEPVCTDYEVLITNYGFAYQGPDKNKAKNIYNEFVKKSIAGYGQVGRETVYFREKGNVLETFDPRLELR